VPVAVLLDYDGTISVRDVGDDLMARFVADQDAVVAMDVRYIAGEVGSRDLIAWDMDMLPDDAPLLREHAAQVPQDAGIIELVGLCRSHDMPVEIVSDGLGFYIDSNLASLGLADIPIITNRNLVAGGGAGVSFPFGHPTCRVCGTCKRERVRAHQDAGRLVVFVGDGPSDRYAAWHADVTFAKGSLRAWCEAAGIETHPWHHLDEVTAWLRQAMMSGALPLDAGAVAAWRADRRPRRPAFICGPEAGMLASPGPMDPEVVAGLT
jgi:2,3-diketo-5-methylthio-1-phosphopentane phosphatase